MRFLILLVAALGAVGLAFGLTHLRAQPGDIPASPVDLTSGLPNDTFKDEPAFDQRIQTRFPLGSSARAMVEELQKQGFKLDSPTTSPDGDYLSRRTEQRSWPCRFDFTVHWRSDVQNRLTSVGGGVFITCL